MKWKYRMKKPVFSTILVEKKQAFSTSRFTFFHFFFFRFNLMRL